MDRRLVLWRDSATILIFVVIGLLAAQTFLPHDVGSPTDTPLPSGIVTGSLPPGVTLAPGVTIGPIIDPSLGVDATGTPIPVITLGPPTPTPSASPTPKPSAKPTAKPTVAPTTGPTAAPTDTPVPTAAPPPPTAGFSCTVEATGLQLTCADLSSGQIDSWDWNWGDGSHDSGSTPPTHTYATDPNPAIVTLTVQGPGGSDQASHQYVLNP